MGDDIAYRIAIDNFCIPGQNSPLAPADLILGIIFISHLFLSVRITHFLFQGGRTRAF